MFQFNIIRGISTRYVKFESVAGQYLDSLLYEASVEKAKLKKMSMIPTLRKINFVNYFSAINHILYFKR